MDAHILEQHEIFELLPTHGKVVTLDADLPMKHALAALASHGATWCALRARDPGRSTPAPHADASRHRETRAARRAPVPVRATTAHLSPRSLPVWDSALQRFVDVFSCTDLVDIVLFAHRALAGAGAPPAAGAAAGDAQTALERCVPARPRTPLERTRAQPPTPTKGATCATCMG